MVLIGGNFGVKAVVDVKFSCFLGFFPSFTYGLFALLDDGSVVSIGYGQ